MMNLLMNKRLITFGLAIMAVVQSYAQSIGEQFQYSGDGGMNLIYQITKWSNSSNGDNQVCVIGTDKTPVEATIPTEVIDRYNNHYKVTSIFRFSYAVNTQKLTIPEGITSIGEGAFGRLDKLETLSLPVSLSEIGKGAFGYCKNLMDITIADGNPYFVVDNYALYNHDKTVFYFCPALAIGDEYTIANTVTTIKESAITSSENLTRLNLPAGLTSISPVSVLECKNLKAYHIDDSNGSFSTIDGLLCDKKHKLITFPEAGGTNSNISADGKIVSLPDYVHEVGEKAFYSNLTINTISLNNVTTVDNEAFARCGNLRTVTIPVGTTSIASSAFSEGGLQNIKVSSDNAVYQDIDGVLFSKDATELLTFPLNHYKYKNPESTDASGYNYEIPAGTVTVKAKAFVGANINKLTFASSVTTLEEDAFASSRLREVEFGSGFSVIPSNAFRQSLVEVIDIPANVTEFQSGAFYNCPSLREVKIADGSKLTKIGESSFGNCPKLESFTFLGCCDQLASIGSQAFLNNTSLMAFALPKNVMSIGAKAFTGCASLKTFEFASDATISQIGASAFADCTGLEEISIPNSVKVISGQAFDGCVGLKKVSIPAGTTNVEYNAFSACTGLTNIEVDKDNMDYASIDGMLCNKDKTTLLIFPGGKAYDNLTLLSPSFTTIGNRAFYSCKNLTTITIPKQVTKIEDEAFALCDQLKTIAFLSDNPVASMGNDVFYPGSGTTPIIDKESFKNIFVRKNSLGNYRSDDFWGKYSNKIKTSFVQDAVEYLPMSDNAVNLLATTSDVHTLVIPATVKDGEDSYQVDMVGDYAFNGASDNIKEVVLEGDIYYIGSWAFNSNKFEENMDATTPPKSNIENIFFISKNQTGTELSTKRFELGDKYAEFTDNQHIYVRKSVKYNAQDTWNGYKDRLEYKIPLPEIKSTYSTFSREFDVDMSADNWNADANCPNVIAFTSGYYHAATTKDENGQAVTNYLVHMESINNGAAEGDGTWIPKNTGVLLKATTSDGKSPADFYYQIAEKDESFTQPNDNLMRAVTVKDQSLAYTNDNDFYRFIISGGAFHRLRASSYNMPVHKSYLQLDKTDYEKVHPNEKTLAKMSFVFDDNSTTGISVVDQDSVKYNDGAFYTLEGVKVEHPTKGVYIHNGKKYVVK